MPGGALELAEECGACLAELGDCLAELGHGSSSLGCESLSQFWRDYHAAQRRLKEEDLQVGVLAMAKSGECGKRIHLANKDRRCRRAILAASLETSAGF